MRAAGQLAARALQMAGSLVQPGVTTDDLDAAVHQYCIEHDAYPSPLLYHGYPKSICTSVNEVSMSWLMVVLWTRCCNLRTDMGGSVLVQDNRGRG